MPNVTIRDQHAAKLKDIQEKRGLPSLAHAFAASVDEAHAKAMDPGANAGTGYLKQPGGPPDPAEPPAKSKTPLKAEDDNAPVDRMKGSRPNPLKAWAGQGGGGRPAFARPGDRDHWSDPDPKDEDEDPNSPIAKRKKARMAKRQGATR